MEVGSVCIQTLERMMARQEKNFTLLPAYGATRLLRGYQEEANEYLAFQVDMLRSMKRRAEATHGRLEQEINLVCFWFAAWRCLIN
jgi:hypothetical protein